MQGKLSPWRVTDRCLHCKSLHFKQLPCSQPAPGRGKGLRKFGDQFPLPSFSVRLSKHWCMQMVWGSTNSSIIPDIQVLKRIGFCTSVPSQAVPFLKGQQYRFLMDNRWHLLNWLSCLCSDYVILTSAWPGRKQWLCILKFYLWSLQLASF